MKVLSAYARAFIREFTLFNEATNKADALSVNKLYVTERKIG